MKTRALKIPIEWLAPDARLTENKCAPNPGRVERDLAVLATYTNGKRTGPLYIHQLNPCRAELVLVETPEKSTQKGILWKSK